MNVYKRKLLTFPEYGAFGQMSIRLVDTIQLAQNVSKNRNQMISGNVETVSLICSNVG